jgi:hypothetical protein
MASSATAGVAETSAPVEKTHLGGRMTAFDASILFSLGWFLESARSWPALVHWPGPDPPESLFNILAAGVRTANEIMHE